MLKLTVHPGEYIKIGDNIKVIMAGRSSNNIYVMVDAPREIGVVRSSLLEEQDSYYVDEKLSDEAVREIKRIISKSKAESRARREADGQEHNVQNNVISNKKTTKIAKTTKSEHTANRRQSAPDKDNRGRKQA